MLPMETDDVDEVRLRLREAADGMLTKLVGVAVMNIDRAFQNAKIEATAEIKRENKGFELIIRSSLSRAEHHRAEEIADAVLQSTLIQASVDQRLH